MKPSAGKRFDWIWQGSAPVVIFAALTVVSLAAGLLLFSNLAKNHKADHLRNLASIAQLKSRQVEAWLDERKGDATVLARQIETPAGRQWLAPEATRAKPPTALVELAESMTSAYKYQDMLVLDANGDIRFSTANAGVLNDAMRKIARQAMRGVKPIDYQIDFGGAASPSEPLLHTFAPLWDDKRKTVLGVLVLRSPVAQLSETIQAWPDDSKTGESVLVARAGDDAVYLTELRHMKDSAFKVRLPLSTPAGSPGWPTVAAANGRHGAFESIDYRQQAVLAYTMPLARTPWSLLVKMDSAEALADTRQEQRIFLAVMAAIAALAGLAVWHWSRRIGQERLAAAQLKQVQERLRASRNALKEAQRVAHVGSWSHDFSSKAVTWSDEVYRIFGLEPGAILPSNDYFRSHVFPDDIELLDVELQRALAEKRNFGIEHRLQLEDGRQRWVFEHCEMVWNDDGAPLRAVGTLQDITERKQAELALRDANLELSANNRQLIDAQQRLARSESILNEAQKVSHVGSWTHDLASGEVTWSDEMYRILGLEPQSRPARNGYFLYHIPAEQRQRVMAQLQQAIAEGRNFSLEHRLLLDNGQTRWVVVHGDLTLDGNGRTRQLIGTLQDITDLKRVESRLMEANTVLTQRNCQISATQTQLLESTTALNEAQRIARIGSWKIHFKSGEVSWSDEVYRILELAPGSRTPDQAYYYRLLHPDDRANVDARYQQALQTGQGYDIEHRLQFESGQIKWVHANFALLRAVDDSLEFAHGTLQDVTERKLAELLLRSANDELKNANRQLAETRDMLVQHEKLASLGQLAAGIAHEINNPISYVHSNVNSMRRYVTDILSVLDAYRKAENAAQPAAALAAASSLAHTLELDYLAEDIKSLLDESGEGLTRVRQIVQDLKSFSRSADSQRWERFDVHKGLDSTLNIMLNEIKYTATIVKEYGDLPEILCMHAKLNQVFMNLIANATQAMSGSDGPRFGNPAANTLTLRTGGDAARNSIWIEIADTGCGIAKENLQRIFDPFFTTKPVGKGTGLGLSLSYGIVKQHNGDIAVTSAPGQGTTFRITLPIEPEVVPDDGRDETVTEASTPS